MLYEIWDRHGKRIGEVGCEPKQIQGYLDTLPVQGAPYRSVPRNPPAHRLNRARAAFYHQPMYVGLFWGALISAPIYYGIYELAMLVHGAL